MARISSRKKSIRRTVVSKVSRTKASSRKDRKPLTVSRMFCPKSLHLMYSTSTARLKRDSGNTQAFSCVNVSTFPKERTLSRLNISATKWSDWASSKPSTCNLKSRIRDSNRVHPKIAWSKNSQLFPLTLVTVISRSNTKMLSNQGVTLTTLLTLTNLWGKLSYQLAKVVAGSRPRSNRDNSNSNPKETTR